MQMKLLTQDDQIIQLTTAIEAVTEEMTKVKSNNTIHVYTYWLELGCLSIVVFISWIACYSFGEHFH